MITFESSVLPGRAEDSVQIRNPNRQLPEMGQIGAEQNLGLSSDAGNFGDLSPIGSECASASGPLARDRTAGRIPQGAVGGGSALTGRLIRRPVGRSRTQLCRHSNGFVIVMTNASLESNCAEGVMVIVWRNELRARRIGRKPTQRSAEEHQPRLPTIHYMALLRPRNSARNPSGPPERTRESCRSVFEFICVSPGCHPKNMPYRKFRKKTDVAGVNRQNSVFARSTSETDVISAHTEPRNISASHYRNSALTRW